MELKKLDHCENTTKTAVFFGHSYIFQKEKARAKLYETVKAYIKLGHKNFLMGRYGDFDDMALGVCRELRKRFDDIKITVILTSYAIFHKKTMIDHVEGFEDEIITYSNADKYSDVETSSYFVEDLHFKRRIIETNRCMVDESDIVICYVDFERLQSGAKKAVNYAKQSGKTIINIYE